MFSPAPPGQVGGDAAAPRLDGLAGNAAAHAFQDRQAVGRLVSLLEQEAGSAFESFCVELMDQGLDPQEVARSLLEPAARSIGAAWCADTQDFVRVTFAVSRLQRLFWRLASRQPPPARRLSDKLALLAPSIGEQHTFGLSVVEDALRRGGWEVDCCRFGEEREMFRLVALNDYRFVGLSLSGGALLPAFASAIAKLRSRSRNPSIVVVAGGSLFDERPELAFAAGADLVGKDARSILRIAEGLLATHGLSAPTCVAAE